MVVLINKNRDFNKRFANKSAIAMMLGHPKPMDSSCTAPVFGTLHDQGRL